MLPRAPKPSEKYGALHRSDWFLWNVWVNDLTFILKSEHISYIRVSVRVDMSTHIVYTSIHIHTSTKKLAHVYIYKLIDSGGKRERNVISTCFPHHTTDRAPHTQHTWMCMNSNATDTDLSWHTSPVYIFRRMWTLSMCIHDYVCICLCTYWYASMYVYVMRRESGRQEEAQPFHCHSPGRRRRP